jgi:methyl-accepting chemotaxis protein
MDVVTNGIAISRSLRDGVLKDGEVILRYSFYIPGTDRLARKVTYARGFPAWNILIGAGAYLDDIDGTFNALAQRCLLLVLAVAVVVAAIGWRVARGMTRPLRALEQRMRRPAEGSLDEDVPGRARQDEIGRMARALLVFRDNAAHMRQLEHDQAAAQARVAADRKATQTRLSQDFDTRVGAVVQTVGAAAASLREAASALGETAEATARESGGAAHASEQASANVQAVASAAEQLSASVSEISRRVTESAPRARRRTSACRSMACAAPPARW